MNIDELLIPPHERILSVTGDFVSCYTALRQRGLELISAEQLASAQMRYDSKKSYEFPKSGPNARRPFAENPLYTGSWIDAAYIYNSDKERSVLVVTGKNNPFRTHVDHLNPGNFDQWGWQFFLDKLPQFNVQELREKADPDPEKAAESGVLLHRYKDEYKDGRRVSDFKYDSTYFMNDTDLRRHALPQFLFRNKMGAYYTFLYKTTPYRSISSSVGSLDPEITTPYATLFWYNPLFSYSSSVDGSDHKIKTVFQEDKTCLAILPDSQNTEERT